MKRYRLGDFLVALVLTLTAVSTAAAQEGEKTTGPRLGPHQFVPHSDVRLPFILTRVDNATGFGSSMGLDVPYLDSDGTPLFTLSGDLFYLSVGMQYQQKVKDWLAVWVGFRGLGRLGTDSQTLLSTGISTFIGFELGWLFRLHETERTLLSGTASMKNSSVTLINLLDWAERVIEDGGFAPGNSLANTTPSLRGAVGVRYAIGQNDLVGYAIAVETGFGETPDRSETGQWFLALDGNVSFNLRERTDVPIGFTTGITYSSFPLIDSDMTTEAYGVLLGVGYTGREDFSATLDMGFGRIPLKSGSFTDTVQTASAVISLRFFF